VPNDLFAQAVAIFQPPKRDEDPFVFDGRQPVACRLKAMLTTD
jgi:hypothetical protein